MCSIFALDPIAFTLGPLTVRWYGIVISSCLLLALLLCSAEAKRQRLNPDHLLDILLLCLPLALIGARAWYVIFNWSHYQGTGLLNIIALWKGGSAIQGGLILAFLGMLGYCRHKGLRFAQWADIVSLGVILGQSLGRWANFFNAEAYGPVIPDGSFWSWVPFQVWDGAAWHHPTFFYEFVWDLLVFLLLLRLIRRPHRHGDIFAWYLLGYCLGRGLIELLRQDQLLLAGFPVTVLVCLGGMALGAALLLRPRRK